MQREQAHSEEPLVCLCPDQGQLPANTVLPPCPIPEHTAFPGHQISRRRDIAITAAIVLAVLAFLVIAASNMRL